MKYLVVLLALPLGGCFFFYIPGSVFESGNACVSENSYVGQRINDPYKGQTATVKEIIGRSERCQSGKTPILAQVEYE